MTFLLSSSFAARHRIFSMARGRKYKAFRQILMRSSRTAFESSLESGRNPGFAERMSRLVMWRYRLGWSLLRLGASSRTNTVSLTLVDWENPGMPAANCTKSPSSSSRSSVQPSALATIPLSCVKATYWAALIMLRDRRCLNGDALTACGKLVRGRTKPIYLPTKSVI